jgi:mono/diheme cytochrome c family protein
MKISGQAISAAVGVLLFTLGGLNLRAAWMQDAPGSAPAAVSGVPAPAPRDVLDRYCVTCHNDRLKTGGLTLAGLDVNRLADHADVWEKVVRKLRSGAMPPAGARRPDQAITRAVAGFLQDGLDREAEANANPGRTTAHRLNRSEYANVVRDLLGLQIDTETLLPPDDTDLGFDNMADILSVSPALLERYMAAARKVSRLAVGDPTMPPAADVYKVPRQRYQDDLMDEDLPFGTRGGLAIRHYAPLDGDYDLKINLRRQLYDYIRGLQKEQQLEVRVDGVRVKVLTVGPAPGKASPWSYAGANQGDREWEEYAQHFDDTMKFRVPLKAGLRIIGVAFVQGRSVRDGVLQPRASGKLLAVAQDWSSPSEAPEASIDSVIITGPHDSKGPGDTPSRRRIFVCRPVRSSDEAACSARILSTIARRAFRRPLDAADTATLLRFYTAGRKDGDFEAGIRTGLESILFDPEFLFRVERDPKGVPSGTAFRVSDLELASRLSFFLWSSIPDDELLEVATRGELREPGVLENQARRMLRDARSKRLVSSFATQWLGLRGLKSVGPTPELFVEFDDNLREAFAQETELFVESQLRDDRGVLELLRADYTFLNERLARHYGIPNVYGSRFRRVTISDGSRGGLLGQGSVLTVTSYPTRTSPVLRGRWLLENIIGAPPPQPPPNVPGLPDQVQVGQLASVRERLEHHRKNPVCAACHAPMDPLGFALDGFDAIGMRRTVGEGGAPIDESAVTPDGVKFEGLTGLRTVLLRDPEQFPTAVTEKLLTFALGRGVSSHDMPAVRRIIRGAAAHDYSWSSIILGIVSSTPFQMRRSDS